MFRRILIANRGEIACRVIRTARRLGIETVAVHSDVDAGALHVAMADAAVAIGGRRPDESYLRGERIIEAALATGAEAIHPGYGFLSENPDFVEAVEAAGLVFIGPSAEAIRAMGLKDAAKVLMERAGVPVVPGYHGDNQDDEHLAGAADAIGWPVLIKAVAGGGGKGMRRVDRPEDFADALAAARSEARAAFGNDAVLIEKFIARPRHIEVQVFGDGARAVHLFERDCSAQRRHQKVLEEAPAPGMTAEMRAAMGQAAIRAAEAIGYCGAGTVEFIVDASEGLRPDRFWFMEMNTRLQVEHPVTEEVTGVDLVEWQIRVAAGEPLPLAQEELALSGHAFEARIYAEDPQAGFLPATGRICHLVLPQWARAETGVRAGDEISPWYDPMIVKLIVHGPTREIALARLRRALAGTEIAGTTTNLGFLSALAAHEGFARGDLDTGLIERDCAALTTPPDPPRAIVAQAVMAGAGVLDAEAAATAGFALWERPWRRVPIEGPGIDEPARLRRLAPDCIEVALGPEILRATRHAGRWWFGPRPVAPWVRTGESVTVFVDGWPLVWRLADPLERDARAGADAADGIRAPMPGLVKALLAAPGQRVAPGDRIAILEAMKMEHALAAPAEARVGEVLVSEGDQVEAGQLLVRFTPSDGSRPATGAEETTG